MLNYPHNFYSSNRITLFPMLPPLHLLRTPARCKFLRKSKSETGFDISDDVTEQSSASRRRQTLTTSGNTRDETAFGSGGKREGWVIPDSSNKSFRFRKNLRTNPAFAAKSPPPDKSTPGKVIQAPSSSSSSSSLSSLDVYSISCLTDLREMRMKEDPDFFLKSKDERPQLQELQQPTSSRSYHRIVNHFNFEPETASHSNVSAFLSDCSCTGSCVCSESGTAAAATRIGPEATAVSHVDVVQCRSQSLVEAKVTAVLSDSSSTNVCIRSSVGNHKLLASIVPVEEPINERTEKSTTTQGFSSKVSILGQSLKCESESSGKTVKFPEVVLSVQDDCDYLRLKPSKTDEFNVFDSKRMSISGQNASAINTNMFVTFATAGSDNAAAAATVGDSSPSTASIAVDSKSRLCLPCAESLVTKWRRIIVALTKNHRSLVRNTRISSLKTSSSALHKEEQDRNSTFSFIFTTSLSASKDPVNYFDHGILQGNTESTRTNREDFDGVEDICSVRTNTALASITSTFTGVLLYKQRCWHLTNYLCIGDRYCASNGQLLCQMSVAGLVILCCHDNRWSVEASTWSEAQQQRSKNNSGSPLRSIRLLEQTTMVTTRLNSPSGYTHPECDSDHAIPMMPCVCGAKVKPSERHNRSALRLNLTGSSLIEIQACFPEMNRFIDGFRRIGRRVMIVSASYPEQCGEGGASLTISDGAANTDSLAFSNPAFDSSNEHYKEKMEGSTDKPQINKSDSSDWQQQSPLPGDTLTVLAVLQHLMQVDRMTFREARNVLLRAHYPLRLSKAVISLLESIEHSMALQRRRAARD